MNTRLEATAKRLSAGPRQNLRDWIYGGIDRAVTTLAVVSGVVGAQFSLRIILIMGFANLVADGEGGITLASSMARAFPHKKRNFPQSQLTIRPHGQQFTQ